MTYMIVHAYNTFVPALLKITIAVMWNELRAYNRLTAHRIATPVCNVFADLKPTV